MEPSSLLHAGSVITRGPVLERQRGSLGFELRTSSVSQLRGNASFVSLDKRKLGVFKPKNLVNFRK